MANPIAGSVIGNSVISRLAAKPRPSISITPSCPGRENSGRPDTSPVVSAAIAKMIATPISLVHSGRGVCPHYRRQIR